jgi:hypothetical protein
MKLRNAIIARAVPIAVAVVLLCSTSNVSAQATGTIYTPFAFTANHQLVPSGFYNVDLLSDCYLALIDSKTGKTQTVLLVRLNQGRG